MARDEMAASENLPPGEVVIKEPVILDQADKNWLLALLDANPREAEQRLKGLYLRLEIFFNVNHGTDTRELAQRTIARAVAKLKAGTPLTGAFGAFCNGVAQKILQEDWREQRRQRKQMPLDDLPFDYEPVAETDSFERFYQTEALTCLRRCLKSLSAASRDLVLRYYEEDQGGRRIEFRKALAAELGISTEALTLRALRIREKLEHCVKPCLGEK